MKSLFLAFPLVLVGCASLHEQVAEFQPGASKEQVIAKLGTPYAIKESEFKNYSSFIYHTDGDTCGLSFKGDEYEEYFCKDRPRKGAGKIALSAVGAVLGGMGDGLIEANKKNLNCTAFGDRLVCH